MRKLYLFRYLLYLDLFEFSRVCLELFIKRILPVTGYKETFENQGLEDYAWIQGIQL